MIYINFQEFESIMQHAKFQDHTTPDLEKKIFEVLFYIYGHCGHLGHVTCARLI